MGRGTEEPSPGTMQGIYAMAAGGVLLGRLNSNDPDRVAAMLEQALAKWETLGADQRRLPAGVVIDPRHRWEDSYPEGGLALVRTARDLPASLDPADEALRPFNRDQAWFSRDEARLWLPREIAPGQSHEVPRVLGERLARFHLVDNVRGQTIPYVASEVTASLRAEVTAVEGGVAELCITGETRAVALGPWLGGDNYWKPQREWPHSIRTALYGEARFDVERGAFVAFDLVGVGLRRGRTVMNGRGREKTTEPQPIGFVFGLAPASLRVAPTFINVYGADWVRHPGE